MDPQRALARYENRADVEAIYISNGFRKQLGVSKKGMRKLEGQGVVLNREIPGACLIAVLGRARDNVIVHAFDEEAEAFAREFEASPRWDLVRLG
jgi:hypothetical protein